jgi:hypothetical protein
LGRTARVADDDTALSAERIGAACRLSVRCLNRPFERGETSLMHYV